MTNYDAIEAINWSTLKQIATSPLHYQWRLKNPEPGKDAFAVGRALHCMLFEAEEFGERFGVYDGVRNPRHKAYQAWLAENEGKDCLKPSEYAEVKGMTEALWRHPVARDLLRGGLSEQPITWTDEVTGIPCKARIDYLQPITLTDLKSTRAIQPRRFVSDAARYHYHGQLAWYYDGAIAAGRLPPDALLPHLVAVDNQPPHDVAAYRCTMEALEAGRGLYRSLLTRYVECQAADWWPGVAPQLLDLDLPRWADAGDVWAEEEPDPFS